MPKLSKKIVDGAMPDASKIVTIWDSDLKGFGLRIMPTGNKTYFIYYRTQEGRQRKLTIGKAGTLTADQARAIARDKLFQAIKGDDPAYEKKQLRQSMTMADLCDEYYADASKRLKPKSLKSIESIIRIHIKPLIGNRTANGLNTLDAIKLRDDIIAGKTAKQRTGRGGHTTGGQTIGNLSLVALSGILEFGRLRGVVTTNIARGIKKKPPKARDRYLSDEEISRLGNIIAQADHEGITGLIAVQFLLLTGLRRNEALTLQYDWIDVEGGSIRFPDTKTGKQVRPIGKAAFDVLDKLKYYRDSNEPEPEPEPGIGQSPYVFKAVRGGGHYIGLPKVLERLCRAANIEGISLHTLRHSFASMAASMGYSELTIAGLLGHSAQGITARYAHIADKALIGAADMVSQRIYEIMNQ